MNGRKQKIEELLVDLQSLKRATLFRMGPTGKMPRITPSQWGVLMMIEASGESTVSDVAKAFGVTSSAATQLVDGLVASKYVTRETYEKDRRIVKLVLSKKTKIQIEKIKKQGIERFLTFFKALNDKEFDQYIALNKKIAGSLSHA